MLILTDEILDVVIIEIKYDNIIKDNYIEIDERYNLDNISDRYDKESIYLLHYPKGEDIVASYGLLNKIENDNIYHLCSTEGGSSGSPIISLKTFKLIGIHLGGCKESKENIGLFIRYAIDEFNKIEKKILNENIKIENKILNENNKRNKYNK